SWLARPVKLYRAPKSRKRYGRSGSKPIRMSWTSLCADCGRRWTIRSRRSWYTRSAASVMSSKRTKPRSIASQLVLFFTLAAALLLCCGLSVFYWIVIRHAFAEDNAVLADKVSALSADFNEGGPKLFGEELKARRAGEHAPYWIRVLDSEGHTLTEMPGMDRILPSKAFPSAQSTTSPLHSPKDYRTAGKLFS